MKLLNTMVVVLPAFILLAACGTRPAVPVQQNSQQQTASSSNQVSGATNSDNTTSNPVVPQQTVAEMEAQKAALEAQKSELVTKQQEVQTQQASFAKNPNAAAMGNFMAGFGAPAALDAAALDDLIAAAMDGDVAGIIDALKDLAADLVDALADIQAQIDALAADIAAAKA